MPVTAGDAKRRAVVVAPDGRTGILTYAPVYSPTSGRHVVGPIKSPPAEARRGQSSRNPGKAVMRGTDGRRYRYRPDDLTVVTDHQETNP